NVKRNEDREVLLCHVEMLERVSRESIQEKNDLETVEDRCRQVRSLLSAGNDRSSLLIDKMLNILR
ncbi:MAG: hypothetical protein KIT39_21225, partial [Nitrospirales bacterium]|nr:hypothetical protein [Nitrospirales bacterium]